MAISFGKKLKRTLCIGGSVLMLTAGALSLASCESAWPKVTMDVSFNGQTYSLAYRLNREYFPQTVRHFIELAESGYYNGMAFHDYTSDGMFTGGYQYDENEAYGLKEVDYFEYVTSGKLTLTQSVYTKTDGTPKAENGLNTVFGEFENNGYTITNNSQKYGVEKKGSLVMYYSPNADVKDSIKVTTEVSRAGDAAKYQKKEYSYNCATSLFYISFNAKSVVNKNYCVFGDLFDDASETAYNNLTNAIKRYIADCDDNGFTEEAILSSYISDPYYGSYNLTDTYNVPRSPIVIKSMQVQK